MGSCRALTTLMRRDRCDDKAFSASGGTSTFGYLFGQACLPSAGSLRRAAPTLKEAAAAAPEKAKKHDVRPKFVVHGDGSAQEFPTEVEDLLNRLPVIVVSQAKSA